MADRPTNRPRRAFGGDEPTPDAGAGLEGRFTEDEARPIFREAAADADAATVRTPAPQTPSSPVPSPSDPPPSDPSPSDPSPSDPSPSDPSPSDPPPSDPPPSDPPPSDPPPSDPPPSDPPSQGASGATSAGAPSAAGTPAVGTPAVGSPGVGTPAGDDGAVEGAGATADAGSADDAGDADDADDADQGPVARAGRLNFTPMARPVEDDATTLLPRTTGRAETTALGVADDEGDDLDGRPRRLGSRGRLAVLIGAVAAVVVVGLAIGTAVIGVRDQPGAAGDPTVTATSSSATPGATALLDDASMLAPQGAQSITGGRTWTAGATVRGAVPDGAGAACIGSDPLEGAPTAQQTISRTLTASGSSAPSALHVAQAYATADDATQAFTTTSQALGTCAAAGDWLTGGRAVEGVGDQSIAAAVTSVVDGRRSRHWVVVSRTGRVLDVVDASTPAKKALNVNDVTKAVASVVTGQCGAAGGTCPTTPSTKDGPPPSGGDEPGFLATGDLPPTGSATTPWVGTPVEAPSEDFTGSQCESVSWTTTAATARSSRVYLLQDVPGIFGLNEIVLTVKDAGTASKLADKVRSDWTTCKERKLTATVDSPTKVTGVGADGAAVTGWTTEVEQKAGSATTRFRVGIASSGDKVAFVFLNPQKGLDVDGDDFNVVAVRAVQRATQS